MVHKDQGPLAAAVPMSVMSRLEVEQYRPEPGEVCISVSDPHASPADLSPAFAAVLRLTFDDVEESRWRDDVLFRPQHAEAVFRFVEEHQGATRIVAHCQGGASRSPALAMGIGDRFGWSTSALEQRFPGWNRHVRRVMGERGRVGRGTDLVPHRARGLRRGLGLITSGAKWVLVGARPARAGTWLSKNWGRQNFG